MMKQNNFKRKEIWKAIVAFTVVLALVLPGAVAFTNNEKPDELNNVINAESLDDFTHTVFAEYVASTTCGYCKYAHAALKTVYASGDYPFYYVSLVCNKNPIAYARAKNDYNFRGYPTVFFDGGYKLNVGGGTSNEAQYRSSITSCGNRAVYDVDINLKVTWLGGTEMKIDVSVDNNESSTYDGTIRAYITEIESSMGWKDTAGYPYTFPFLDWAFNEEISIPAKGTWSDSTTWDGSANGYPSITKDNIMIIAAVFNDEWHQGYAYPPYSNPFDSYYVDETTAATPNGGNMPPNTPRPPSGPTSGTVGVEYTYTSITTDPDDDDLFYLWDWNDGTSSEWLGPFNSGDTVEASHTWDNEGIYDVKVKAKDVHDAESSWSDTLTVCISDEPIPIIKIGDISGGLFKISAVIKNIGSVDATNVNWSITLDGGFILLGRETSRIIINIPAGEDVTVSSGLVLGFGKTVVTVMAECAEGSSDTKMKEFFLFLFIIPPKPY